jgi:hypothetical protein
MGFSLSCLISATQPWVTEPLRIPKHLHFKVTASRFGLKVSENDIFDDLHVVYETADAIQETFRAAVDVELMNVFLRLGLLIKQPSTRLTERGYRYVGRMSADRPYVIFSDLHMAHVGNRQDFFASSGNRELYRDVLSQYAASEFTLIENGDVEELLIFEPTASEAARRRELAEAGDTHDPLGSSWKALDDHRLAFRRDQLDLIIDSNRELYTQINDQFHRHGRYIRVAGNHDQDIQEGDLLETLRSVYPNLDAPFDFLIIEPSGATSGAGPFVVTHGHHFDHQCTPLWARRLGEAYSEALAWAYQGADRIWAWDGDDDVRSWTSGEAFRASLVSDDPAVWSGLDEVLLAAALLGVAGAQLSGPLTAALAAAGGATAILTTQLGNPALWESAFGHNISWDYFERPTVAENVFNEVLCGTEWFKFRHLDELTLTAAMPSMFPSAAGHLVLGHSHEARHSTLSGAGEPLLEYLNSGAAGRFENMLWGVEIVDGVAQVVAWHRPGGPRSSDAPQRYVYQPTLVGGVQFLTPSATAVALPATTTPRWLEAVLHVMMA